MVLRQFQLGLGSAGGDAALARLYQGLVARNRYLGVVLGVRIGTPVFDAFLLLSFPSPALGLALCAGLCHR